MGFPKKALSAVASFLLLPFALNTIPGPVQAQVSSDTAARSDTLAARPAAGDSLANKTADSTRGTKPDSAATAASPPAPAPPSPPSVDSAFATACNPPPPEAPVASLLLVTFSPALTQRERLDIAKRVGATLAGIATSGERYLRVSGGSTRAAADSLILYQGVTQVSERPCPVLAPSGR